MSGPTKLWHWQSSAACKRQKAVSVRQKSQTGAAHSLSTHLAAYLPTSGTWNLSSVERPRVYAMYL